VFDGLNSLSQQDKRMNCIPKLIDKVLLWIALITTVPAGAVELVVGAPVTEAVSEPFSVDFDAAGAMYGVEFTKGNRIFKWHSGKLSFIAGETHVTQGPSKVAEPMVSTDPLRARFNGMHDIQVTREGCLIIADSFHHQLHLMDMVAGKVSVLAGTGVPGFSGDGGSASDAQFNITMTACLTPKQDAVLVADIGNHRVRQVDLASGVVKTVAGNGRRGLPADGEEALHTALGDARAVTQAKDGTLYVLLRGGNALVEVKAGKVRTVVNAAGLKGYSGDGGPAREAKLNGPKYVMMDAKGGVVICDTENHCVRRYDPETERIELLAGMPTKASDAVDKDWLSTGLKRPHGVRVGPEGWLYVCDSENHRVLRGALP
jgi:hypothetical protein